jgi:hypothetical protein
MPRESINRGPRSRIQTRSSPEGWQERTVRSDHPPYRISLERGVVDALVTESRLSAGAAIVQVFLRAALRTACFGRRGGRSTAAGWRRALPLPTPPSDRAPRFLHLPQSRESSDWGLQFNVNDSVEE